MKADQVSTRIGKGGCQRIDRLNHQVHIHRNRRAIGLFGVRLQSLADHGAKSQVRHVMVVHHVKVNPVCASGNHIAHFFAQTGKVGRKNRGGDAVGG